MLIQILPLISATKESKNESPNPECCIPVVGNEFPPRAIDNDFFCIKVYQEVCPLNIAELVNIRVTLANVTACRKNGKSYQDCYFIYTEEDCFNSPDFQSLLINVYGLLLENCEDIDIQGKGN